MREILQLLREYGVGMVALVAVGALGLAAWRGFWPLVKTRWELADRILTENANRTQSLLETTLKEFENQLRESNRVSAGIARHLETLTKELKRKPRRR